MTLSKKNRSFHFRLPKIIWRVPAMIVFIGCLPMTLLAQNQFAPIPTAIQCENGICQNGPKESWPDPQDHKTFDSQVQQAVHTEQSLDVGNIVGSVIDSATTRISAIKNDISNQPNGLLGTILNADPETGSFDLKRMLGSLAIVLGGYFGFVWLVRKISPAANQKLPSQVIQILGQSPFSHKKNLQLVRLGNKLVLLLTGPEGTQPIGEITDPNEVEHLTSLCGGNAKPVQRRTTANNAVAAVPADTELNSETRQSLAKILSSLEGLTQKQGGSVFEA